MSCATTSVVAALRARPSTLLFALSTASKIAGRSCGSSRGTSFRIRDRVRIVVFDASRAPDVLPTPSATASTSESSPTWMIAAESSFGVSLSGERTLRTQTSPCGND
ncbi:MAG TPA: hypothetical protein VL131_16275 [Gammaproteobacteria bacterium]|nr:hypothetical protein [Gammaproteobacteria bacterium]